MKTKYTFFLILNISVAVSYFFINEIPIPKQYFYIANLTWNIIFGLLLALIFIHKDLFTWLSRFSFESFIVGLSLTSFTAYMANYLYSLYVATPTIHTLASKSLETLFIILPLLVIGEELISINITTALNKIGMKFWISSFIVAILFAFWHTKSFGFVPLQLLAILVPIRIALNYTFRKSNSLLTVILVHYTFDVLAFTVFY